MHWLRPDHRRDPDDAVAEFEKRSYMALEEARVRSGQLEECALSAAERRCLERHVGLAGYHASDEIACGERLQYLAIAHQRAAGVLVDRQHRLRIISALIEQAVVALEEALDVTVEDHLQLAHLNALEAQAILAHARMPTAPGRGAARPRAGGSG
jgi:hypothetical protein